jgi:hypothetical protein
MYLAIAIVLLNLGINVFTMRKRKLPRGKDPGFIALYHIARNPERRARAKTRMEERRKLRRELKEKRKAEKEALKSAAAEEKKEREAKLPSPEIPSEKKKAPVLDLHRTDDDFDIIIPEERPKPSERPRSKPFTRAPRKREKVEKDMIDVLSNLDD